MKRTALLVALCLVLAGCASVPDRRPAEGGSAPEIGAVDAPGPAIGVQVPATVAQAPAPAAPATQASAAQAPAPAAQAPTAPAPETQASVTPAPTPSAPTGRLQNLVQVDLPAPGALGPAYRDPERMNQSAWSTAEGGLHFIYTGHPELGSALAPDLADRFRQAPPVAPEARIWTTFASSWDEGQERFYFHLQVTARSEDGVIHRAGIDVIEVSHLPGYGYLVTGFAHAPWASEQEQSPVKVWTGAGPDAYQAPREVTLPALPIAEGGRYLVPLAVAGEVGQVRQISTHTYVVDLAAGATSGEMTTVTRKGLPYVYAEDLVTALNGRRAALPDASGAYSYQAEWHPLTRQLFLWADEQRRMS